VEIFIIPGTGITGFIGAVLIIGSLLFGMVDKIEWGDWQGGKLEGGFLELLAGPARSLAIGLMGALVLVILLMRYLPRVPVFKALTLQKALATGASRVAAEAVSPERTGWTGEALTDLRPAGKVRFQDETLDVVADGGFIPRGATVRITEEDGMRIVVRAIRPPGP